MFHEDLRLNRMGRKPRKIRGQVAPAFSAYVMGDSMKEKPFGGS
jgi:hypothetical protein